MWQKINKQLEGLKFDNKKIQNSFKTVLQEANITNPKYTLKAFKQKIVYFMMAKKQRHTNPCHESANKIKNTSNDETENKYTSLCTDLSGLKLLQLTLLSD